jgi:hypothetical protein
LNTDRIGELLNRLSQALTAQENALTVQRAAEAKRETYRRDIHLKLVDITHATETALNALQERRQVDVSSTAFAALTRYSLHQLAIASYGREEAAARAMTTNLRILAFALAAPSSGYTDPALNDWLKVLGESGPIPKQTNDGPHPHAPAMAQLIRQVRDAGLRLSELPGLFAVNGRDVHFIHPS